jgi:hypothetical protein
VFAAACTVHEFCNGAEPPSSALAEVAYAVRSPVGQEPQYDLSWETPDAIMVAEVKSLTARNEERQLRLGLGQVLRYRHLLSAAGTNVRPVLAVERKPRDHSWSELSKSLGVILCWPPDFSEV